MYNIKLTDANIFSIRRMKVSSKKQPRVQVVKAMIYIMNYLKTPTEQRLTHVLLLLQKILTCKASQKADQTT